MELAADLVNNQLMLCIPVVLVLVGAILVFVFGFKKAAQPPFDKLTSTNDERKLANKKRKIKEKKVASNGHISNSGEKSPVKEQKKSPAKETQNSNKKKQESNKQAEKNKKNEAVKNKKVETIEEIKNKKNKVKNEKPLDFDDAGWETVPTKADKKKKQEASPAKKDTTADKKKKKESDKQVKEVVNKELREKDSKQKDNKEIEKENVAKKEVVAEEKKEKKEKKGKKEKDVNDVEVILKQINEVKNESAAPKKQPEGAVIIDELGDTWTEAKVAKKGKKKARRDN